MSIVAMLVCISAFAAPAKIEPKRAPEMLKESKIAASSTKKAEADLYVSVVTKAVATSGKKHGNDSDIQNSFNNGGEKYFTFVSEAAAKGDSVTLELVSYHAKSIINEADAASLMEKAKNGNLVKVSGANDYNKSIHLITKGDSTIGFAAAAIKAADPFVKSYNERALAKKEKTLTIEEWLEKLKTCT